MPDPIDPSLFDSPPKANPGPGYTYPGTSPNESPNLNPGTPYKDPITGVWSYVDSDLKLHVMPKYLQQQLDGATYDGTPASSAALSKLQAQIDQWAAANGIALKKLDVQQNIADTKSFDVERGQDLSREQNRSDNLRSLIESRNANSIALANAYQSAAAQAAQFAASPKDAYAELMYRNAVGGATPFGATENPQFSQYQAALQQKMQDLFGGAANAYQRATEFVSSIPPEQYFPGGIYPTSATQATDAARQAAPPGYGDINQFAAAQYQKDPEAFKAWTDATAPQGNAAGGEMTMGNAKKPMMQEMHHITKTSPDGKVEHHIVSKSAPFQPKQTGGKNKEVDGHGFVRQMRAAMGNYTGDASGGSQILPEPTVLMGLSGKIYGTASENGPEEETPEAGGFKFTPQPGVDRTLHPAVQRAIINAVQGHAFGGTAEGAGNATTGEVWQPRMIGGVQRGWVTVDANGNWHVKDTNTAHDQAWHAARDAAIQKLWDASPMWRNNAYYGWKQYSRGNAPGFAAPGGGGWDSAPAGGGSGLTTTAPDPGMTNNPPPDQNSPPVVNFAGGGIWNPPARSPIDPIDMPNPNPVPVNPWAHPVSGFTPVNPWANPGIPSGTAQIRPPTVPHRVSPYSGTRIPAPAGGTPVLDRVPGFAAGGMTDEGAASLRALAGAGLTPSQIGQLAQTHPNGGAAPAAGGSGSAMPGATGTNYDPMNMNPALGTNRKGYGVGYQGGGDYGTTPDERAYELWATGHGIDPKAPNDAARWQYLSEMSTRGNPIVAYGVTYYPNPGESQADFNARMAPLQAQEERALHGGVGPNDQTTSGGSRRSIRDALYANSPNAGTATPEQAAQAAAITGYTRKAGGGGLGHGTPSPAAATGGTGGATTPPASGASTGALTSQIATWLKSHGVPAEAGQALPDPRLLVPIWNDLQNDPTMYDYIVAAYAAQGIPESDLISTVKRFMPGSTAPPRVNF